MDTTINVALQTQNYKHLYNTCLLFMLKKDKGSIQTLHEQISNTNIIQTTSYICGTSRNISLQTAFFAINYTSYTYGQWLCWESVNTEAVKR
jgi:hypothetical protein